MHRFTAALTSLGLAVLLGAAGCTQAIGERCQVDTDCTPNVCNTSTKTCQIDNTNPNGNDGGIDAPLDGAIVDTAEIDAPTDAAVDAATDAAIDAP